jgi:hypothetical protein
MDSNKTTKPPKKISTKPEAKPKATKQPILQFGGSIDK